MEVDDKATEELRPKPENPAAKGTDGATAGSETAIMAVCEAILDAFMEKADAGPFLDPVNPKAYPWYYEVIDIPMCFVQMKEKFTAFEYEEPEVVLARTDSTLSIHNSE